MKENQANTGRKIALLAVLLLAVGAVIVFVLSQSQSLPAQEAAFRYAGQGQTEALDDLLRGKPELVNQPNSYGVTLLHEAAQRADVPVAQILLERGADVNVRDKKGKTPLDWAEEELGRAQKWDCAPGEARKMIALLKARGGERGQEAGGREQGSE